MASAQTLSRKTVVGAVVIGIHVLFGLALIAGTAVKYVPQISDLMNIDLIKKEDEPPPKEPPPPPPDFKPPPVQPPPSLDLPVVRGPPIPTAIALPKQEVPKPAAPPAPPPITQARIAKGSNLGEACSSYYPSASRRLSEEGSVVLLIYIAPNGRVSETKVETSSGIQRLDEAAEKCVKAQGKFEPSHVGNEAVGSWQRMKWTWRLTS
jgi:periplasmic protein TonB